MGFVKSGLGKVEKSSETPVTPVSHQSSLELLPQLSEKEEAL